MDTFTFGNIAVGQKFQVVNLASGTVVTAKVYTKVEPFQFKTGRPFHNYTCENKGKRFSGTLRDTDVVVLR